MSLLAILEYLRRNLKGVLLFSYVMLALLIVADIVRSLTSSHHGAPAAAAHGAAQAAPAAAPAAHGFWGSLFHLAENVPVFWTVFGFVGCLLLVVVSKTLLSSLVAQPEEHQDE